MRRAGLRVIKYEAKGNFLYLLEMTSLSRFGLPSPGAVLLLCKCSEKRASALAIRNDGLHVCLADKFVVVWVVNLSGVGGTRRSS
ncbi:hypothetical protein Golax_010604 [Gossypium laxum]|uniref:Uncharacterized protein n=1 Tax=Gossypium laxum TaxID=34288 RepID=A0A7J8ZI25_9ROSI|nr:hypothetical protein [Gossypium laxum]